MLSLNTTVLDASALSQAQAMLEKEVAAKTKEWTPQANPKLVPILGTIMGRFVVRIQATTAPEQALDILEQFRRYKPLLQQDEVEKFAIDRLLFSCQLRDIVNVRNGITKPDEDKIAAPYHIEAIKLRSKVMHAGLMFDANELALIKKEWEAIAAEWKGKLDQHRAGQLPVSS